MKETELTPGVTVGIDVVEIDRIRELVERWGDRFLNRCFTEVERAYSRKRSRSLAARFAAKEACYKALNDALPGIGWQDIEVVNDDRGRPELLFHHKAAESAERCGWIRVSLSLTHAGPVAVAVVVALTDMRHSREVAAGSP